MNIITSKISKDYGGGRGYIWYDTTVPTKLYPFKWSLTYDMIPEPKTFSDDYIKTFPEDFGKPSIIERVLILLKLKQDDPRGRFKQS
jgi:hypothetical protein